MLNFQERKFCSSDLRTTQTPSAERLTRLEVLTGCTGEKEKRNPREDNKIINGNRKCNECETQETALTVKENYGKSKSISKWRNGLEDRFIGFCELRGSNAFGNKALEVVLTILFLMFDLKCFLRKVM
ncbi:hypothetical protein CEXT_629781 [Caerostris extrusa]|uniref:Uncharacterized protein n=1 Tax=Caerostris extrusa TaxID=172846 RepID=A0AAV4V206_CAEEX|nr:hypothetical protein CEXT_629781 [Caerostris extrusa]